MARDAIKLEALDLAIGESKYIYCPFCRAKHEAKCSITRTEDGILYNCYRSSCGRTGFIPSMSGNRGSAKLSSRSGVAVQKPRPTSAITDRLMAFLLRRYTLSREAIQKEGWLCDRVANRLVMPIRDAFGTQFGTCTKALPEEFGKKAYPKVLMAFTDETTPRLHFPLGGVWSRKKLVLVEDIISATKLDYLGISAAALLGTHITKEVGLYLASIFPKVTLALDNDATTKAIKLKQQWELFFRDGIEVVPMLKDPKDTAPEHLLETFVNGRLF